MFDVSWIFTRLAGIFLFGGILLDIEIIILISNLISLHMNLGLRVILNDYIHINKIKIALLFLIRVAGIEISRYILEILL
uniref:succinate dehydrogenase subunit 4 n=1 Tax=Crassiphycus birdiae TaxID=2782747 RepID=UPI001D116685|nr:succinate dehydrogenase subunit 4 [Crassiphycus birdiae]YP_010199876.1 succinate dehydrogenase subunit 4 [Crassiphycus usneoides]UAD89409.1 succinate dehydrogenase subunit 4 [Crassiphycus birdiae]UAD89884.1 succinate dehydrogenase subunit 4 [Crassiphycus usneoides]